MGTRANIILKDSYDKLYFYKHYDGYPSGTLPIIEEFLKMIKSGKIRNNVHQSNGWLIMLGAIDLHCIDYNSKTGRTSEKRVTLKNLVKDKKSMNSWKVGSIEVTTDIHGDIEYLYIIDVEKQTVEVIEKDFEKYSLRYESIK